MTTTGKMAFTLDGIIESNVRDKEAVAHLLYEIKQMLWSIEQYENGGLSDFQTQDIHLSNALMNDVLCHEFSFLQDFLFTSS